MIPSMVMVTGNLHQYKGGSGHANTESGDRKATLEDDDGGNATAEEHNSIEASIQEGGGECLTLKNGCEDTVDNGGGDFLTMENSGKDTVEDGNSEISTTQNNSGADAATDKGDVDVDYDDDKNTDRVMICCHV